MTLWGGVLGCWPNKQRSVALSIWESDLFSAITSGTRSLGTQSELENLACSCSATIATDSQSVIDHSRRQGHSAASKHVGLRGLWLQEALADKKLTLEKVHTAANRADVCTKALLGDKIRELCRLAHVYVCHSEDAVCTDSENCSLSQLDRSCRRECSEQSCEAQPEGARWIHMSQFRSQSHLAVTPLPVLKDFL